MKRMDTKKSIFNFDNTYVKLPKVFYSPQQPDEISNPEMILFNHELAEELDIDDSNPDLLLKILSGNLLTKGSEPISTSYAGHQFGHFTMLGDGRVVLLGEHLDQVGRRFDVQLKGSGPTRYSRGGDGKSTLRASLKEYIYSEAIHHLGIPSSRSLSVIRSDEKIYRQTKEDSAVLCRVMQGFVRVGTFEFAAYFTNTEMLKNFLDYTIQRFYPNLKNAENKALALIDRVMDRQIDLIVGWMRVGFIHGVMNTDNTSITGESFDYGPCAFMGVYKPNTVFSSIDENGRYAFGNQPAVLKWNLSRLAEALLPLIDEDEDKAVEIATSKINEFDQRFETIYREMMLCKIGISEEENGDFELVNEFLDLMKKNKKDYTHSFNYLRLPGLYKNSEFILGAEFFKWTEKWRQRIERGTGRGAAMSLMERYNPVFIPRNYFVEEALDLAIQSDFRKLNTLLYNLKMPYWYDTEMDDSLFEPKDFDLNYKTYCGT